MSGLNDSFDLRQVVIVNENRDKNAPGAVSIFRSEEAACLALEPWWVEADEGTALTAAGDRLVLAATDPVTVAVRERHPDGRRLVGVWLSKLAFDVHRVRKGSAPPPTSPSDLIAYIGFDD